MIRIIRITLTAVLLGSIYGETGIFTTIALGLFFIKNELENIIAEREL